MFLNNYKKYDKGDEFEADRVGMRIYDYLDLPPRRFDDFFERVLIEHGDRGGKTHPLTSERIARMEVFFETSSVRSLAERDSSELRRLQFSVASHIRILANSQSLHDYDSETVRLGSLGYITYPAFACGAFDVDYNELQRDFVQLLRRFGGGGP